ncbi:MAG: ADP/ATP-dependent (S)-NAD(P)H-hydrate dehydratase [Acidimicrobiales bacterium]
MGSTADKHARGQVLVVGGSRETPGGVLLAGIAALRVGAGRLQLATADSVARELAIAVPEARVIGLLENNSGTVFGSAANAVSAETEGADAVLVGTGALDADETGELLCGLLQYVGDTTTIIIDAAGLGFLAQESAMLLRFSGRTVVTLRSVETWTSAPGESRFRDRSGHAALGTAGSGDVLAGALTGLAARGADPLRATLWAVHCHGLAGEAAAGRGPGIGLLARELLAELPYVLRSLEA